ncbi:MAG: alpha/beta hydrolase family protein [Thiolinea sp.]
MRHIQLRIIHWFLLFCLITLFGLAACGDEENTNSQADNSDTTATLTSQTVKRGDWKRTELTAEHSLEAIKQAGSVLGPDVPVTSLQYAVKLHRLVYTTTDGNGQLINASAALALPVKNPQLASPLLSFQHGTLFYNAEAPGNDTSAASPHALLASLGYIVIAADYVGYGISQGTPHPYLQKTASANAVTDLIQASRYWLEQQTVPLNQQLFLTGYSQGGHVTMAAHQALEQSGNHDVTASIPAAGPYNLVATLDKLTSEYRFRQQKKILMANSVMQPAQRLSPVVADALADFVIDQVIPTDTDIVFSNKVIYDYLRTDGEATTQENVYDWKALAPVRLHHGKDDQVVPFKNATDALAAMQARGSTDTTLIECLATPKADHDNCIAPYGLLVTEYFGGIAQGL